MKTLESFDKFKTNSRSVNEAIDYYWDAPTKNPDEIKRRMMILGYHHEDDSSAATETYTINPDGTVTMLNHGYGNNRTVKIPESMRALPCYFADDKGLILETDYYVNVSLKSLEGAPSICKRIALLGLSDGGLLKDLSKVKHLNELSLYGPDGGRLRLVDLSFLSSTKCITLNIKGSSIRSLNGCPSSIKNLNFKDTDLSDLTGCPDSVNQFEIIHSKLSSLAGSPSKAQNVNLNHNQLTTLEGGPEIVTGWYNCSNNSLRNIHGAPKSVRGEFKCTNNGMVLSKANIDVPMKCRKFTGKAGNIPDTQYANLEYDKSDII